MMASRRSMEKTCGCPQIARQNQFVHLYLPLMQGSIPEAKNWCLNVPVAATSKIVNSRWQTAHLKTRVWAYRKSLKKSHTGYQINLWSGAKGKNFVTFLNLCFKRSRSKFVNEVAPHIEGLRHPPLCLFETLFSCQCPFNHFKITFKYFKTVNVFINFFYTNDSWHNFKFLKSHIFVRDSFLKRLANLPAAVKEKVNFVFYTVLRKKCPNFAFSISFINKLPTLYSITRSIYPKFFIQFKFSVL
jgi:hypothetical protein